MLSSTNPIIVHEDIVISGVAGKYPNSKNVAEFQHNLYNKIDMCDDKPLRFTPNTSGIPNRMGKIPELEKFDGKFFGINYISGQLMDSQLRVLMEVTYEAIFDAGINPIELRNTNTGVFLGFMGSDSIFDRIQSRQHFCHVEFLGNYHNMFANHISHLLKVSGPSIYVDTACSTSGTVLHQAFTAIRCGDCDAAIVASSQIQNQTLIIKQFAELGVLTKDGYCRPFDINASGYSKSEAICVIFLQKLRNAKRVHASLVYTKISADGYKPEGITYPSSIEQSLLFSKFYADINLSPLNVKYVEAHGTATIVGDPQECKAIGEVFCKDRVKPLLIGSVKSNIGHAEASATLCGVIKSILALNTGIISPTIHFKTYRQDVPEFVNGQIKVCYENTKLDGQLIAINSFGFGGANFHGLLKQNVKSKVDVNLSTFTGLPYLIQWAGRTIESIDSLFDFIKSNTFDLEFIGLLHNINIGKITEFSMRGYCLISKKRTGEVNCLQKYSQSCKNPVETIILICNGFTEQFAENNKDFYDVMIFNESIQESNRIINQIRRNVEDISSKEKTLFTTKIITIIKNQIALIDTLIEININIDYYSSELTGELLCAYAMGLLSKEHIFQITYDLCNILWSHKITKFGELTTVNYIFIRNKVLNFINYIKFNHNNMIDSFEELFGNKYLNSVKRFKRNSILLSVSGHHLSFKLTTTSNRVKNYISAQNVDNNLHRFLITLGQLYLYGINMDISKLYPRITFPVSRETPLISPLIKWDHSTDWRLVKYEHRISKNDTAIRKVEISLMEHEYDFYSGHIVNGRCLIPATGYICMVWETFSMLHFQSYYSFSVELNNVKFRRATVLTQKKQTNLLISLHLGTGNFEITEDETIVVSGSIKKLPKNQNQKIYGILPPTTSKNRLPLILNQANFYKNLRIKGYQFSGQFLSISNINVNTSEAEIKWTNNYTTFLDGMLQLGSLQDSSNQLQLPTGIQVIKLDMEEQLKAIDQLNIYDDQPVLKCSRNPYTNIITAGGIQLDNLQTTTVSRRKIHKNPLFESYNFFPYYSNNQINLLDGILIGLQIMCENRLSKKNIRIVEIQCETWKPIIKTIETALQYVPTVSGELILLTSNEMELSGVTIENKYISHISKSDVIIVSECFTNHETFKEMKSSMHDKSYLVVRESSGTDINTFTCPSDFQIISTIQTFDETLVIIQLTNTQEMNTEYIKISKDDTQYEWLEKVKNLNQNINTIVFYTEREPGSGIIGLVNCLRKEFKTKHLSCMFIDDEDAPLFDPAIAFYTSQLNQNLAMNVYRKGTWGSYRHFNLKQEVETKRQNTHCYVNTLDPGDLSNVEWYTGHLTDLNKDDKDIVSIQYASLNFRDVIMATGMIHMSLTINNRYQQEKILGLEYAGINKNGKKLMGAALYGGIGTHIKPVEKAVWDVPDNWSMKEAATCPVAYATVLEAYFHFKPIRKNQSILIHAASGGVGLAAIRIALFYNMKIFVTVSNAVKRNFLLETYPELIASNIGNSRDCTFQRMIKIQTGGIGVDYVLNSLTDEKLITSIRCLKRGGVLLEIGKIEFQNNLQIQLNHLLQKNISIFPILIDQFFLRPAHTRIKLHKLVDDCIKSGAVQPLYCEEYPIEDLKAALRYLGTGKHKGKIVLKIRENPFDEFSTPLNVLPCIYFDPLSVYIVPGGLGGVGLELIDWMVTRGARKIVINSRNGIKDSLQQLKIMYWEQHDCTILINQDNMATYDGCKKLFTTANTLGKINGIFNLAVVLNDATIENQTAEKFEKCFKPKAIATKYLDEISRDMCPAINFFVVFSSVTCGRGNAGQSNYGMANSVMERIIEKRIADGLTGKVIQWGAIGDVGLFAEMVKYNTNAEISGTIPQTITSCLASLDRLLNTSEAIVSSMVLADKNTNARKMNLFDDVLQILGFENAKKVGLNMKLTDIGMDSMLLIEVKALLESEYNVTLGTKELAAFTLINLQQLSDKLLKR